MIEAVPGPIGRALDRIESSLREPNLVRFSSSWAVVLGATLALGMLVAALLALAGRRGD